MNTVAIALLAGATFGSALAQTAPPVPSGHGDVQAATGVSSENSGNTQATAAQQAKNVTTSKAAPKLSKQEKSQLAKDATKLNVNPENSTGQAATARMQQQTVSWSKRTAKPNAELRTQQGKKQLDTDLRSKSSP